MEVPIFFISSVRFLSFLMILDLLYHPNGRVRFCYEASCIRCIRKLKFFRHDVFFNCMRAPVDQLKEGWKDVMVFGQVCMMVEMEWLELLQINYIGKLSDC